MVVYYIYISYKIIYNLNMVRKILIIIPNPKNYLVVLAQEQDSLMNMAEH